MRSQQTIQRRSLDAYLQLCELRTEWKRNLVALTGSETARPFGYGTLAAGGAVLWICQSEKALTEANQSLLTDFTVDTLSEALRILKNEIRKGSPISVGLRAEPKTTISEMELRGVQPYALLADANESAVLMQRGAVALTPATPRANATVNTGKHWRERRSLDATLMQQFGSAQALIATRWVQASARLFPRDLERWYCADWFSTHTLITKGQPQ